MSILYWTLQPLSSSLTSVTLLTNTSSTRTVGGVGHYRPDCLSDSLHSDVKSESISLGKLQISTEYYQQLAVKNDHRGEMIHYFCHLQNTGKLGKCEQCLLIVFIQERRFIYLSCLAGSSRQCIAAVSLICHLSLECYNVILSTNIHSIPTLIFYLRLRYKSYLVISCLLSRISSCLAPPQT